MKSIPKLNISRGCWKCNKELCYILLHAFNSFILIHVVLFFNLSQGHHPFNSFLQSPFRIIRYISFSRQKRVESISTDPDKSRNRLSFNGMQFCFMLFDKKKIFHFLLFAHTSKWIHLHFSTYLNFAVVSHLLSDEVENLNCSIIEIISRDIFGWFENETFLFPLFLLSFKMAIAEFLEVWGRKKDHDIHSYSRIFT